MAISGKKMRTIVTTTAIGMNHHVDAKTSLTVIFCPWLTPGSLQIAWRVA